MTVCCKILCCVHAVCNLFVVLKPPALRISSNVYNNFFLILRFSLLGKNPTINLLNLHKNKYAGLNLDTTLY